MKKLILVTSPPACGKTFVTKKLAKAMPNCVYLDKDSLIVLSKQIFVVANQEYNRSSDFFEENIRNYEYDAIMEVAREALEYNDTVFINSPFTREVRTPGYMENLRQDLLKIGAELVVVWVQCDVEVCRQRMIARNSDRDTWKLENWDEYIKKINFTVPDGIKNLFLFNNSSDEAFKKSLDEAVKYFKNLKFNTFNYALHEPRSDDIKEIATAKVKQAYEIVKRPCIALDTDFRIDELNGFPRAFVNFSLETVGIQGILKLMEDKSNRKCAFNECLAYHDGKEIHYFYGKHPGNLSKQIQGKDRKEKWSDLWYIFKPEGFEKTLAEMDEKERENRKDVDGSYSAMEKFAEWYQKKV